MDDMWIIWLIGPEAIRYANKLYQN